MMHFELLDIALIGGVPVLILLLVFLGIKLSPRLRAAPPSGPRTLLVGSLVMLGFMAAGLFLLRDRETQQSLYLFAMVTAWNGASAYRAALKLTDAGWRRFARLTAAGVQIAAVMAWVLLLTGRLASAWARDPVTLALTAGTGAAVAAILGLANWFERRPKPSDTPPPAMEPTA